MALRISIVALLAVLVCVGCQSTPAGGPLTKDQVTGTWKTVDDSWVLIFDKMGQLESVKTDFISSPIKVKDGSADSQVENISVNYILGPTHAKFNANKRELNAHIELEQMSITTEGQNDPLIMGPITATLIGPVSADGIQWTAACTKDVPTEPGQPDKMARETKTLNFRKVVN